MNYGDSLTGVSVPAVTLPPTPVVLDDVEVSTLTSVGAAGPQPTLKVRRRAAAVAAIILAVFTRRSLRGKGKNERLSEPLSYAS